MKNIKVSLDACQFIEKPKDQTAAILSQRIGSEATVLNTLEDIQSFALNVGCKGHTFCPATFKDGKRSKKKFEQQQFFALDFDNKIPKKTVSFKDVQDRANRYDLPILFAYDTFSSKNHDKFRIVFLNDISIPDRKVAEAVQLALGNIFPEADSSCYRDISKMYFGGYSKLLYYNDTIPTINIESIFRNLVYYFNDRYKANHYKEKIAKFSAETGIGLTSKGLLDVTSQDRIDTLISQGHLPEDIGAKQSHQSGKKSPRTIIYEGSRIANGEFFPKYYQIRMKGTEKVSGGKTTKSFTVQKQNHKTERASIIPVIGLKCRLWREFENGERRLNHTERFGVLNNMINVETGGQRFMEILISHPELYNDSIAKWGRHIKYNQKHEYRPTECRKFCPYHNDCQHGYSIISTAHPKRSTAEKVSGYSEKFYPLPQVQEDTYDAIYKAYRAEGNNIHVIKAQTAIGKTSSYLRLILEHHEDSFLIAAPTNLLKNEIFDKANSMGIKICKTPSLEEIKDEIPDKIWRHIQWLYQTGQHRAVHSYINQTLEKNNIPCLVKYLKKKNNLQNFKGCVVTTHRYLLTMKENRLNEFDSIIVDEDIIFKSVLSNQGEITISNLKKLLKNATHFQLRQKIEVLLTLAKKQCCIHLDSFEWDEEDYDEDSDIPFDFHSFCMAEHFYLRRASEEHNLKEDTITFLKPATFKNVKHIVVSATANETIYRQFFHDRDVEFYECKSAKYTGRLFQYPRKSMSRSSIASNPGIIRRLVTYFCFDDSHVITFLNEHIGKLHFGNTEGSNTLEGEDILVIGTPYYAGFLYKLAAFSMGIDFDEDESMTSQYVTHNGYRFWITTFQNEDLRTIQFWMIESELEQAVGRARLLRNDCTVHLFSKFPLKQSYMIDDFNY